jgi:hypothetical protein
MAAVDDVGEEQLGAPRLSWRVGLTERCRDMGPGKKYPPELRERAVRMVFGLLVLLGRLRPPRSQAAFLGPGGGREEAPDRVEHGPDVESLVIQQA